MKLSGSPATPSRAAGSHPTPDRAPALARGKPRDYDGEMQSHKSSGFLRALRVCVLAPLTLFPAPSLAQQQYKIATVTFQNPGPYSQEQLLTASGLHVGDPATAATLQAAAQKLSDTGFFDDIGAEIGGTTAHVIAIFKLKPTPQADMLPIAFDNFVWLTPGEIQQAIHDRVPLYAGYLPEVGVQLDQLTDALVAALAAKGIPAKVAHRTVEASLTHPLRSIAYAVTSPLVRVANIKLAGVTPALVPLVQQSVNATAQRPYSESSTSTAILTPLLNAGYINATLTAVTLDTPPPDAAGEPIVLHATLLPGDIFHIASISFAGTSMLSADAFNASARLHPGDVASRKDLLATLAPLDLAYRRQGYMDVIVKADPTEDAAAHTVAYTVLITPGEQYHVAKVTATGLDPAAQADFDQHFLLKPGALFDPTYAVGFIRNNTALKTLAPYNGAWQAIADPNSHTVELVLTFVRGPVVNVH
jgi:hypothetical protein